MHWYDPATGARVIEILKRDGTPYKAVPRKVIDGLGYVPGVTDIMKKASPYTGLAMYERLVAMRESAYYVAALKRAVLTDSNMKEVRQVVSQTLARPANDGTRKHIAFAKGCEGTLKGVDDMDKDIALETYSTVRKIFPEEAFCYASEMEFCTREYGGTMDLVVFSRSSRKPVCLIDAKFPMSERGTRDTECIQLAAYKNSLLTKYGKCDILVGNWMYGEGGIYKRRRYTDEQLDRGMECFNAMLEAWKQLRALGSALKEKMEMELTPFSDVN